MTDFSATHTAPAGGIQAWAEPDPGQQPVATLAAATPLRVVEERGAWARVEAENGWSGWVDSARLQSVAPEPAPAAAEPGQASAAPPPPPSPSGFQPTHTVPAGGMQAWAQPDPTTPSAVTLGAGTPLRVMEQRGAWARTEASNGWSGWVDATRLVLVGIPVMATPTPAIPGVTGELGQPRKIGTSILLAIVTLGIYTYVWTYKTHNEIKKHSGLGVGGPIGLVIYLLVGIVTPFLLASEVRQMYEANGLQSPVKGSTGAWILLPLAGAFVWFFKVQGALNDFWVSKGAQPV